MTEFRQVVSNAQCVHELANGSLWPASGIKLLGTKVSDASGRRYGLEAILIVAGVYDSDKLNEKRIELNPVVPAVRTHE